MGSRQKYRELAIGPAEKITARASTVGLVVIADYNDPITQKRTLLLKRPSSKPGIVEAPKAATTRKKKAANGAEESPSKSLDFPGEAATGA